MRGLRDLASDVFAACVVGLVWFAVRAVPQTKAALRVIVPPEPSSPEMPFEREARETAEAPVPPRAVPLRLPVAVPADPRDVAARLAARGRQIERMPPGPAKDAANELWAADLVENEAAIEAAAERRAVG